MIHPHALGLVTPPRDDQKLRGSAPYSPHPDKHHEDDGKKLSLDKQGGSASPAPFGRPPPAPPPPYPALAPIYSGSVAANFAQELGGIDVESCDAHGENAFFVCDLAEVYRQHERWMRVLGDRIEPFFAVKCNPDPHVLRLLASLGTGFDCASQSEISSVLSLGIAPERIIYANPCKAASFVRNAAKTGIRTMTFDNADEIAKVKKYHPAARMVLRILTDDSGSLCRLGLKFGAPLSEVRALMREAKRVGLEVVGVSFHVGSGCSNPELFGDAVRRARYAFDVAREEGFELDLLDIGGGFMPDNFEDIAAVLRREVDACFPRGDGVKVIAEPGRYYVADAFQLATNIIARRGINVGDEESPANKQSVDEQEQEKQSDASEETPTVMYYVNDGLYASFNCVLFDHQHVTPKVLTLQGKFLPDGELEPEVALAPSSVWGPTCDGIDLVCPQATLPTDDLEVGDWLRWERMGAYTICAASQFNGFKRSEVRYTIDTHGDAAVEAAIRAHFPAN